jgi:hypothetical protein
MGGQLERRGFNRGIGPRPIESRRGHQAPVCAALCCAALCCAVNGKASLVRRRVEIRLAIPQQVDQGGGARIRPRANRRSNRTWRDTWAPELHAILKLFFFSSCPRSTVTLAAEVPCHAVLLIDGPPRQKKRRCEGRGNHDDKGSTSLF